MSSISPFITIHPYNTDPYFSSEPHSDSFDSDVSDDSITAPPSSPNLQQEAIHTFSAPFVPFHLLQKVQDYYSKQPFSQQPDEGK